jgi:hypothetical protein
MEVGVEAFLIGLSIAMFGAQLLAWRWAIGVERGLIGQDGFELAHLLTWIIGWSTVARVAGLAAVITIGMDHQKVDEAQTSALIAQIIGALIFFGAAFKIRRISRDREADLDAAEAGVRDRIERIGVEIDQVGVRPTVTVDDSDPDAR